MDLPCAHSFQQRDGYSWLRSGPASEGWGQTQKETYLHHCRPAAYAPLASCRRSEFKPYLMRKRPFAPSFDSKGQVTPCPGAVSHLSHTRPGSNHSLLCADPEQPLPRCAANAEEVANSNSEWFWRRLGCFPLLFNRRGLQGSHLAA